MVSSVRWLSQRWRPGFQEASNVDTTLYYVPIDNNYSIANLLADRAMAELASQVSRDEVRAMAGPAGPGLTWWLSLR